MFAKLPFLKNRMPKMKQESMTVPYADGGSVDADREDHRQIALGLADEAVKAVHAADHERFHSAMEAYLDHMANKPEESEDAES